jgi:hypothetical protein
MTRNTLVRVWILFLILLSNFAAQIVYFYHLYYTPQHPFPIPRSTLLMGSVFVLFLVSFILLLRKPKIGFYAMTFYLCLEFFFYLWNIISSGLRPGYGWFLHLRDRDPILWAVFAIGYLSFLASGYFLMLLIFQRRSFVR